MYYLLSVKDYTTYELYKKLEMGGYIQLYINDILNYLIENKLIDDQKYIINYIEYMKNKKSKKQIQYALIKKGIDKNLIELVLDKEYTDDIDLAINLLSKKYKNIEKIDYNTKSKMYNYLSRKGFGNSNIFKAINFFDNLY